MTVGDTLGRLNNYSYTAGNQLHRITDFDGRTASYNIAPYVCSPYASYIGCVHCSRMKNWWRRLFDGFDNGLLPRR